MAKQKQQPTNDPYERARKQLYNSHKSDQLYKRLDKYQLEYYEAILDNPFVTVDCPAGTGKTTIAVMAGLELLRSGQVGCLMYVRFPDDTAGSLGYLPGELEEKEDIYMTAFYDAASECGLQPEAVDVLREMGLIKLTTVISFRGINIKDTFCILDETQNATLKQLQLALTRLHDNGKCVMIGHSKQCDNKLQTYGGYLPFELYQLHMLQKPWAVKCNLPVNYRGKISNWADKIGETVEFYKSQSPGKKGE